MNRKSIGRPPIGVLAAAVAAIGALAVTSCSASSGPAGPHPSTQPAPSTSVPGSSSPASTTPPVHPIKCASGWKTGPTTVTHQVPVPPVPVARAIRTGSHPDCRFDRLVIDFSRPLPGYKISFVTKVIRDGSGKTIAIPGTRFLEIMFSPADGHSASGTPTLPVTVQSVGYPMLRSYVVAGDFEGHLTIALGLAGGAKYRSGEVGSASSATGTGPGGVYVDVSW